jgi:acetate kinase
MHLPLVQEGILSVNVGSSTLKFALYPLTGDGVGAATQVGAIEGLQQGESAFAAALDKLIKRLADVDPPPRLLAVAHRVVHGGAKFQTSVRVTEAVLQDLAQLNALAPLHQPHNLEGIRRFWRAMPEIPQIACFDTAFHASMTAQETRFALPEALFQQGIRRYGFHGLSYQHVRDTLQLHSARARGRLLMAHLGSGASLCAAQEGRSMASTMGFTALDGLMMGTRCGALDPGVLLYLVQQGWDAQRLETLLYRQSGLLGVSGLSADLRVLRAASSDDRAKCAIDLFTARVVREAGAMAAVLGGLDLLAFTGGIGEHDAQLRSDVAARLGFLGVVLDPLKNRAGRQGRVEAIHARESAVEVWVVPADEGLAAAKEALALL